MQYKIENDTLLPAPRNFRTPEGATICNFNAAPELMSRHGYTVTEAEAEVWREAHPAPPPPPRTTCTKYELITALRERFPALLAALRSAYERDEEIRFFWASVQDLDRENADFQVAAGRLGITAEQLDAIFAAVGEV